MIFFERFERASKRIVDQLWQSEHLDTSARNEAIAVLSAPLDIRLWVERFLMAVAAIFLTASVMLFFAYNWAQIPAMVKMGGILGLIGFLALVNWFLLHRRKTFIANLVLTVNAFIVGVFMAVYGQIYQTGADSYTLFLTWAIMILPWVVMARFLPLWMMWLVVANLALWLWWELGIYSDILSDEHYYIVSSVFHILIYIVLLSAIKLGEDWLDKKWVRILLSISMFAPLTVYICMAIIEFKLQKVGFGFILCFGIFLGLYAYVKWVGRFIDEYSVGFFCATIIVVSLVSRVIVEYVTDNGEATVGFFLLSGAVIGIFYYAYKYYRYVITGFEETL